MTSDLFSRCLWWAGSGLALIVLLLQIIYFNSLRISAISPLRPLAEPLCQLLDCPLQASPERRRIISRELMILDHPLAEDARLVETVIVNKADSPQPYPPLTLVFEDARGKRVAQRTFSPAEYLHRSVASDELMPRNRAIKLELEIVDPGPEAVSARLSTAQPRP